MDRESVAELSGQSQTRLLTSLGTGPRVRNRRGDTSHARRAEQAGLSLGRPHLADFGILIYLNRKYGLAHPMLVDVDLKEGYPDGRA
jgi:hypothetical protein